MLRLSRSSCKVAPSFSVIILHQIFVSSANILSSFLMQSGSSFTNIKNSSGPNTLPCGTPLRTIARYVRRTVRAFVEIFSWASVDTTQLLVYVVLTTRCQILDVIAARSRCPYAEMQLNTYILKIKLFHLTYGTDHAKGHAETFFLSRAQEVEYYLHVPSRAPLYCKISNEYDVAFFRLRFLAYLYVHGPSTYRYVEHGPTIDFKAVYRDEATFKTYYTIHRYAHTTNERFWERWYVAVIVRADAILS